MLNLILCILAGALLPLALCQLKVTVNLYRFLSKRFVLHVLHVSFLSPSNLAALQRLQVSAKSGHLTAFFVLALACVGVSAAAWILGARIEFSGSPAGLLFGWRWGASYLKEQVLMLDCLLMEIQITGKIPENEALR